MPARAKILILASLAAALITAQYFAAPWMLTAFLSLFAVIASGYLIGPRLTADCRPARNASRSDAGGPQTAFIWGSLGSLALLMLVRGAWFYAGLKLDAWGDVWTATISLGLSCLWLLLDRRIIESTAGDPPVSTTGGAHTARSCLLFILSLTGLVLIASAAFSRGTTESIRTPWPLMPGWTLLLVGLLWILALVTAWRARSALIAAIQTACALAATLVIAPLLYRIGYGFDGFLHVAGEKVLLATGTLLPKPPYYIGQYVFVTWLSRLSDIDISLIDRWLVPLAAAFLIPAALAITVGRDRMTTLIALILMPLGVFVATTPHGFATLLAITALLLLCNPDDPTTRRPVRSSRPILPFLFSLWSSLTHPLVGLPVLAAVLMASTHRVSNRWKALHHASWILAIVAGLIIPFVFWLGSALGLETGVTFNLANLAKTDAWLRLFQSWIPWVGNRYAVWPEAAVWVEKLLPWLTLLFALLAVVRHRQRPLSANRPASAGQTAQPSRLWLLAAASVALSATVLKLAGDFDFLIDYERGDYAARLFFVAGLLLLPLAIPELGRRLESARRAPRANIVGLLAALGLLGAGASYAALPRHDAATPSRGWSVGAADVEAVKLIDEDSGGRSYTVLANQSVSAAAVRTFGFKRYTGAVFFYPIPTGGPLYQLYLRASYEDPSREVMREAARLGGSDLVYFALNDYWWKVDQIAERAAETADRTFTLRDGKVRVYKYDLTQPDRRPRSDEK